MATQLQPFERVVEQLLLLLLVDLGRAGGRAARLHPGHHAQRVARLPDLVGAMEHELPGAHVLGLLLQPHQVLGVRVALQRGQQLLLGEREQLLDADDCRGHAGLVPASQRVEGDLARAEDQPLDGRGVVDPRVVEDLLERPARQLVHRRT